MLPRDLANIQILLYEVKRQLQYADDRKYDELLKTVYEVENFLEKQVVDTPPQEWKPYF